MNKEERNRKLRERRKKTNNIPTKKYEKTKKGFLVRLYRNMLSRITGIQKQKHYLYEGKELLNKEDFYNWSLESKKFHELFEHWEKNNYDRKLTPSVNRIDSSKGYIISNMEWITHSENSAKVNNNKLTLTYKDTTKYVTEWAKDLGIDSCTLRARIYAGWPDERIIETKVKKK